MIDDLPPYPEMRDSGVAWLGEVPAHWEVRRAKYVLREIDQRSEDGSEDLLRVSQYTGVTKRGKVGDNDETDTRATSLVGYKRVRSGDLAVNIMLAWNGSLGVSPHDGIVSPAYCVYRLGDEALPAYYHHLYRTSLYKDRFRIASRGVVDSRLRLYTDDLYRVESLLPPPQEQAAIVRFLVEADRRIGGYVAAKLKLVKLLEEAKASIIHRAVTKGLNTAAPMKPSGVPWLSDIPAHWDVVRLRNLAQFVTSGSRGWSSYAADDGPAFVRIGNLTRTSTRLRRDKMMRLNLPANAASEAPRARIQPGDLLLSITAYVGSIAVAPSDLGEAYVSQHVALCRLNDPGIAEWVGYVLLSPVGQMHGTLCMNGGTKQGLSLDDVKNYVVIVPPAEERRQIVQRIEAETATLDIAIATARAEIGLLREYRARLIADVVTGKRDVRAAAAALPDIADDAPLPDALAEDAEEAEDAVEDAEAA